MSVLSSELREWLKPGLLGVVAAVDATGQPQIGRHWAARALAETDVLELYLLRVAGDRCLQIFAKQARAALNLIELPSYRSRLFKGDCSLSGVAIDAEFLAESVAATNRAIQGVGMPADGVQRMAGSVDPKDFVALRLVVDSIFDQSPKPGAGAPL